MKSPTQGKRFYCREWVFAKMAQFLDAHETSTLPSTSSGCSEIDTQTMLIVGGAGSGKTAVCSELVWPTTVISKQSELHARLLAYHFCRLDDVGTLSVGEFLEDLTQQLLDSDLLDGYERMLSEDSKRRAWLCNDPKTRARADQFPREAFRNVISEPLNDLIPACKDSLFLLIDLAHDESCYQSTCSSCQLAELLASVRTWLPKWLKLIVTTRRQCKTVWKAFQGCRRLMLDDLRRSCVVRDVQQYILHRLDLEEQLRLQLTLDTAEMLNQLHIKSNGCLLYLELILDCVVDGFTALREVQHIPSTLYGLYLWLCQRLFARKHSFAEIRPIFEVMLVAKRPLTADQLFQCVRTSDVDVSVKEFLLRMKSVSRLLWLNDEQCSFVHQSFAEWLSDVKYSTQKYLCDKTAGHGYLAMWYSARGPVLSLEECVDFAYHLRRMRIKPPLNESHLPLWLVQSGAPMQQLVLGNFVYDEPTTRLLIDAGADFISLDFGNQVEEEPNGPDDETCGKTEIGETQKPDQTIDEDELNGGGSAADETVLHSAASEGRASTVKLLMSRGIFCDAEDANGDSPLILAARHGHGAVCEHLLEAGADPDHANTQGWTALRSAAWGGHLAVIEVLLRYDVQIDCCSNDGRSALRAAAWGGHEDCVRILLSVGANPNKQDVDGRTPLMAAAYMGHAEVVDILLRNGADPNLVDRDGRTALSVAAGCSSATPVDHVGVARLLLDRGAKVDCTDVGGKTPLLQCVAEGNLQMCQLFLEKGADPDAHDKDDNTALLTAAAFGRAPIVKLLLDRDTDGGIDSIDSSGRTVLTVAAANGNCDVVRMLLTKGLDEMHKDNGGWSPLHYAAFEGHANVCRLLCDYNPKTVHVIDNEGRHPLILAVEEGHEEAGRTLLDYGSDVNKPALDGQQALRIAAVSGHKGLCHLLISRGADVDYCDLEGRSTLYALIFERQLEMAEYLLSFGTRVDNRDPQARTPLHVACWHGDLPAVELLIKYGADVNTRDSEGNTPLMVVVWRSHLAVAKFLLSRGADVNAVCQQGGATALSIAAQEGRDDMVKLLLEHHADPEHVDCYGRTPSMVASKAGKNHIVSLLNDFQQLSNNGRTSAMNNATNTTLSGSSNDTKTSGYMSLSQALCSSLESPFATVELAKGAASTSRSRPEANNNMRSCQSSNKSTLSSSCASPDEDFSRRILEHSLPRIPGRPNSRPSSIVLPNFDLKAVRLDDFEALKVDVDATTSSIINALTSMVDWNTDQVYDSKLERKQDEEECNGDVRPQRTRILTNPKCRRTANRFGDQNKEQNLPNLSLIRDSSANVQGVFLKKETQL